MTAQEPKIDFQLAGSPKGLFFNPARPEGSDRPKLSAALAHAKTLGATLVVAKLDRLSRSVDFLRKLLASDVDLVFCDLPHVPAGTTGRFLLTRMASVAELEAGLISERTK